jgi:hypothetical protein
VQEGYLDELSVSESQRKSRGSGSTSEGPTISRKKTKSVVLEKQPGSPLYTGKGRAVKDAEQQRWFSGQTKEKRIDSAAWMSWAGPGVP